MRGSYGRRSRIGLRTRGKKYAEEAKPGAYLRPRATARTLRLQKYPVALAGLAVSWRFRSSVCDGCQKEIFPVPHFRSGTAESVDERTPVRRSHAVAEISRQYPARLEKRSVIATADPARGPPENAGGRHPQPRLDHSHRFIAGGEQTHQEQWGHPIVEAAGVNGPVGGSEKPKPDCRREILVDGK